MQLGVQLACLHNFEKSRQIPVKFHKISTKKWWMKRLKNSTSSVRAAGCATEEVEKIQCPFSVRAAGCAAGCTAGCASLIQCPLSVRAAGCAAGCA